MKKLVPIIILLIIGYFLYKTFVTQEGLTLPTFGKPDGSGSGPNPPPRVPAPPE